MDLPTNERDLRVAALLDEALAEYRGTGRLDVSSWQSRHPDLADDIPDLLKTLRDVDTTLADLRAAAATEAETSAVAAAPGETINAPNLQTPLVVDGLPEKFGRYRIKQKLGQGAMGAVYLAEDTQLARDVALKVPKFSAEQPELLKRFQREAQAAAHLRHVNICPVYDVGEIDGTQYLTMAFIDGKPLKEFIDHDKPVPQAQAAAVVRKLALALQEAHKHGVVHRDLKPANIMIDKNKEPVIMDFGLAYRSGPTGSRLTHEGALMGTPAYMSPEQASGETQTIGPPTDIYALGVILYELLTGHLPFEGPVSKVLGDIMYIQPDPPSKHRRDLDPKLEGICLQAMAKKVGERFASMADFAAALGKYLREWTERRTSPVDEAARFVPPADTANRGRSGPLRLRNLIAAALFFALIAAGGIVITMSDKGTVEIQIDDPDVEVVVKNGGQEVLIVDKPGRQTARLKSGTYEVKLRKGQEEFTVDAKEFTLKRGDIEVVHVTRKPVSERLAAFTSIRETNFAALKRARRPDRWVIRWDSSFSEDWFREWSNLGAIIVAPKDKNDLGYSTFWLYQTVLGKQPQKKVAARADIDALHRVWFLDRRPTAVKEFLGLESDPPFIAYFIPEQLEQELLRQECAFRRIDVADEDQMEGWETVFRVKREGERFLVSVLEQNSPNSRKDMAFSLGLRAKPRPKFDENVPRPAASLQAADPERRAAEWVLSIGGTVRVNNQSGDIRRLAELPREPFVLTSIDANRNPQVTDARLECFKNCRHVAFVDLANTPTGDAGLANFKNCTDLEMLYLAGTQVGDAGLANLKDCKKLTHLFLQLTNVTDAGLANFRDCKNLRQMNLSNTQIGDEGLANFKDCTKLALLDMSSTKLSDQGLANFKDCKEITRVWLNNTPVTNAGIAHLKGCKNLTNLELKDTRVTPAGIEDLKKALPRCQILSDFGTFDPTAK